jgi:hypothetical protein
MKNLSTLTKLATLTFKSFCLLALAFLFGAFMASSAGASPLVVLSAGSAAAVLSFVPLQKDSNALYSITATAVVTEWGAFYRAEGQNIKDIITKLMQRSVTAGYFPTRITDKTILEKVTAEFARVLQRFQKGYTPIGGTTFEPTKIPLYKLKIDLLETPDDLEESWLGFLADSNLDRRQWPYIKWFLMNTLIQADKDLELNEIYAGVPGTITAGTATAAGTSLKGIKKQINEFHAAGKTNTVVMGAVPATATDAGKKDLVKYVEDMIKATPRLLRNELDFVFLSEDLHDDFRDGMRLTYNVNYESVADNKITQLRNDNIKLVGLPSMVGAKKIWTTPSWNRQGGFKKPANGKIFEVEKVDRAVKVYTDYYKGFGFWIPQYIVTNDVELT